MPVAIIPSGDMLLEGSMSTEVITPVVGQQLGGVLHFLIWLYSWRRPPTMKLPAWSPSWCRHPRE